MTTQITVTSTDPGVRVELHDGFVVDTDRSRLELATVHHWLSTDAFCALGRSFDAVPSGTSLHQPRRLQRRGHTSRVRPGLHRYGDLRPAPRWPPRPPRSRSWPRHSVIGSHCRRDSPIGPESLHAFHRRRPRPIRPDRIHPLPRPTKTHGPGTERRIGTPEDAHARGHKVGHTLCDTSIYPPW